MKKNIFLSLTLLFITSYVIPAAQPAQQSDLLQIGRLATLRAYQNNAVTNQGTQQRNYLELALNALAERSNRVVNPAADHSAAATANATTHLQWARLKSVTWSPANRLWVAYTDPNFNACLAQSIQDVLQDIDHIPNLIDKSQRLWQAYNVAIWIAESQLRSH